MTQTDPTTHFVNAILEYLDETFEHHHGFYLDRGTSLFETLATVSAEEASRPVSPCCASIAAQVNHITSYLGVLGTAVRGKEVGKVDWNEAWSIGPVDDPQWNALIADLRTAAAETARLIRGITEWGEDQAYGSIAMLVHTAHHLGEIRQALCTIQPNR